MAPNIIKKRMNLPLDALMLKFESLGENCEFGLVQRRCGAEPLGLLRFSSSPLKKLLNALAMRFDGMGSADTIRIKTSANGEEYMVSDLRFGFEYHAWVLVGEQTPEEVLERECRRVPFLIRKLTEDLAEGAKIFVYHGMSPLSQDEAVGLHRAMQTFGSPTLLWVELADEHHPPGTVEWVFPGLMKGYLDRFAPGENAHDISLGGWVSVCRAAVRLFDARTAELASRKSPVEAAAKYQGHVDELTRFSITGWVANQADWKQSLAVEILVNGETVATCEANLFRKGLDDVHPDATGRYMFKYYFESPLKVPVAQDVKVRVKSSDYFLA